VRALIWERLIHESTNLIEPEHPAEQSLCEDIKVLLCNCKVPVRRILLCTIFIENSLSDFTSHAITKMDNIISGNIFEGSACLLT